MHVTHQPMLRMREIGDHAVMRVGAGQCGVPVRGEVRGDVVVVQLQQAQVAPETGVVFLRVLDDLLG